MCAELLTHRPPPHLRGARMVPPPPTLLTPLAMAAAATGGGPRSSQPPPPGVPLTEEAAGATEGHRRSTHLREAAVHRAAPGRLKSLSTHVTRSATSHWQV